MNDRFGSVLAVHAAHHREVAVEAAEHLARMAGVPLTVFELADREQMTLKSTSGPSDVASAIKTRDGALLVLDALGGGPDADRLFDADAEHLLANVPLPTLVFGPHATLDTSRPVVLIAADHGPASAASLAVAQAWISTFAAHAVVVGLDSPDSWPPDPTGATVDEPRHLAATLAAAGVSVELQRRSTLDPADTLVAAAADVPGGVLVIPAARYPTGMSHWFSTSRRLIRHASRPVLLATPPV
jgi:nucleotide-binding universal stress UspA family protein